jgi:endoglucanase
MLKFSIILGRWAARLGLGVLLAALCLGAPLPASADDIPALKRGLNLSSWLANAPRQPLYLRDFAQIRDAGFDHVRLPFNPTYYGYAFDRQTDYAGRVDFRALDRALDMAAQYNLPVILDIHAGGEFIDTLENNGWAEARFVELWRTIAERYKDRAASALVFELLNEPQYYKVETRWARLSARLVKTIRAVSPDRAIVVGAPHGSEIDGLNFLQPLPDPRVIYAFHFYEPYMVTHQGIHMGFEKLMLRHFRGVPYPSALAAALPSARAAPNAPHPQQAAEELQAYIDAGWKAEKIAARIAVAAAWAERHKVRLLCGEFGVLRNHIDAASRMRWIGDARAAMDRAGIGWELWDYADIFGIAPPVGATSTDPVDGAVTLNDANAGSRRFEPAALQALGLGGAP